MIVFINNQGELTCSRLDSSTTVTDLINAVLTFCQTHVACTVCKQTCCAGLTVYPDHVFLNHLLQLSRNTLSVQDLAALSIRVMLFDKVTKKWFLPQNGDGRCKFLSRENRCTIYTARPLVCRLHVCGRIEPSFRELKQNIYFAYQDALRQEMARRLQPECSPAANARQTTNPTISFSTYDTPVSDILAWIDEFNSPNAQTPLRLLDQSFPD